MSGIDEAVESVGESEVDPAMIQKLKDAMKAKGADAEEPIGLIKLESQWREKYDDLETELNLTRVSDNACRSTVDNFGEACLKSKTPVECRKNIEKLMQELELLRKAKKNEDSDDEDEDDIEEERLRKELEAERSDAVVSAASLGLEWYVDIPTTTHDTGIPRRVTVTGLGIRIKAMPWLIGKDEKHASRPWLRRIAYYSKQDNSYYLFRGVSKMYDENERLGVSYWEWKDNFEYVVRALGDSIAAEELQKKYTAMEKEALAKKEAMAFYQKYDDDETPDQREKRWMKYQITKAEIDNEVDRLVKLWEDETIEQVDKKWDENVDFEYIAKERLQAKVERERVMAISTVASTGLEWREGIRTTTIHPVNPRNVVVSGLGIKIPATRWLLTLGEEHRTRPWSGGVTAYYSKEDHCYYLFRGVSEMRNVADGTLTYYQWEDNFGYRIGYPADFPGGKELQEKYKEARKEALAKKEAMAFYQKYKGRAETCEQDVSSLEAALEERERERLMSLHDRRPYRVPVTVPVPVAIPFPRFVSLGRWSPTYPRGRIHSSFGMLPPRRMVQHEMTPRRIRRV